MKKNPLVFAVTILILAALACGVNFSSAKIAAAKMAKDPDGQEPTTVFAQDETFYCVVQLANAPDDTKVKAAWVAVEVEGTEPNLAIDTTELVSGDGLLQFKLANDQLWPAGKYKVDLYLNDKLDQTLEFSVEGTATAAATPTDTPAPEPTATPEPEPSPTPEPTATPEPTEAVQGSAGDSLNPSPATAEATAEALPMRPDPYTHPSGAFTFSVPEAWKMVKEDDASATFGDGNSGVGAVFVDAGAVYTEKQMQDFINTFTDNFINAFATDYTVLEQKVQPDDSIYVAVSYDATDGKGDADFFFEQRETVLFVLYFVSSTYEEVQPTWDAIIASYRVDPQAALAAAPATPTVAPATPTPAPPPTAAPANNQYAPQPGRSRVYIINKYKDELTFTINNTENRVPVNGQVPVDMDAGKYTYTISIPGGAVNGEVEMAPNQSWAVLVDENGTVYYPQQIYP